MSSTRPTSRPRRPPQQTGPAAHIDDETNTNGPNRQSPSRTRSSERTEERHRRIQMAARTIVQSLSAVAAGIGAHDRSNSRSTEDMAVGTVMFAAHSALVWPLDASRMRMAVWQLPSWFAARSPAARLTFRPPSNVPSSAGPAFAASIVESATVPVARLAYRLGVAAAERAMVLAAPPSLNGRSTPVTAADLVPPPLMRAVQAATRVASPVVTVLAPLAPDAARYAAFPLRMTARLRQIGHPGPRLTVSTYLRIVAAPMTSYHLSGGAPRHSDLAWWAAHRSLDATEDATAYVVRAAMVHARSVAATPVVDRYGAPIPGVVSPQSPKSRVSGLAILLLETWFPPLLAKIAVHVPRTALIRAQLGLPALPWADLVDGVEPYVLAEVMLDWALIELAARVADTARSYLNPPGYNNNNTSSSSSNSRR
ncbi:hypothetical protein BC828DRAFT_390989 [Blastocladiella britannica]|nr:hypothetical protein BC828DRAFT_390989 [Blastocladiella britannica]